MNVLAAEWLKFRTLRSTLWALAASVGCALVLTVSTGVTSLSSLDAGHSADQAGLRVWAVVFVGVMLSALLIGMLGVITMTGEHASGMISLTYTAMPSRRGVLLAKVVVLAGAALTAFVLIGAIGYVYGRLVAAPFHPSFLPTDAWQRIGAAALMLLMTALVGLALGALLRSGAVAAVVLIAIVFVLPVILMGIPGGSDVGRFLPLVAGMQLLDQSPQDYMPTGAAFAVLAAWATVPIGTVLAITPGPWRHRATGPEALESGR
ncbi:hypothetical protein ABZU75_25225 [Streptosporangium sp. NPDC005286]|uniref:hypothetical protein n=1 Tax=Streptosporangium sp. NPDC005286 TaxID=3154463 RepID=UPI00339F2DA4